MFECYGNIIGFSQHDCECTEEGRPTDYNVSNSGLFLDELSPITGLVGAAECDKSMWDILTAARNTAIKKVVADSNSLLGRKYTLRRKVASNQILGQIKAKDIVSPSKNYAVVRLACSPIRSGIMKLNNLGGVFSGNGSVTISLYDNVSGFIQDFNITTQANTHQSVSVSLELPLHSKYVDVLEYYFVYQFDNANLPKETELNCGCGNWTPSFNLKTPYYRNVGGHKSTPWADYVMLGGGQINSISELEDFGDTMKNDMYGLTLDVNFTCKVNEVICKDSLDFVGNPLALSLAFAVRYATGVEVAEAIMKSTLLNRENMVAREDWEESSIIWQEKYNEHINYIVDNVDHTANDCLTCKDLLGMTRQGLFA